MTERDFQKSVVDLAQMLGWKVAHFRPAMTSKGWRTPVAADGKGFPDLLMARRERLVAAELKVGRNRTSSEQEGWLARFAACGVEVYVWRPDDLGASILDRLR